jgi:hypothetical protein
MYKFTRNEDGVVTVVNTRTGNAIYYADPSDYIKVNGKLQTVGGTTEEDIMASIDV